MHRRGSQLFFAKTSVQIPGDAIVLGWKDNNQHPTNMKKFLAIYYAPAEAMQGMANATDEQKQEGMKPWLQWKEKHGKNIEDIGAPLMPAQSITPSGKWGGSHKDVTGYSIVKAENADAAKKLFEGHPHLGWASGCSIEVSEMGAM